MVQGISLRLVSQHNLSKVCQLKVSSSQELFVAPNSISIAQAAYEQAAWLRAIYYREDLVGFVMVKMHPRLPFLWRLMIDAKAQGSGYGSMALRRVLQEFSSQDVLVTSYRPGKGSPGPFYERFGFKPVQDLASLGALGAEIKEYGEVALEYPIR